MSTAPVTAQRAVEPGGFYSQHDLYLMFGISTKITEAAWLSGTLPGTDVTGDGEAYSQRYRGTDVQTWMDAGCPTAKSRVAPAKAAASAQAAAAARPSRPQAEMDREVMSIFHTSVDQLAATGMPRSEAVKHVKQHAPNIYAAGMATANVHRTPEARTPTARDTFEQKVLAKMAGGMSRVQAAKSVAAESAA